MSGIEALLTGRTLADRYRIEAVIGRGGMGAVYRAIDERLGRAVALKVITAAAAADPETQDRVRARFRHEAASAARLPHHPNVVPVYDYGTDPVLGLDFIVMELLRGEDLASRLARSGPPPLGLALRILREAARGVAVGHRAGLVHRDVKPGNIFLVHDEDPRQLQVRVLDFGIAKAVADEDTHTALTQDGRAPLSPAYASPEQLRAEPRLTPASDVFSLGALAYQMVTGQRPFTEPDRNRMSVGMEVPIPSVRARNAALPAEVEEIVRRALAHEPAQRFSDAAEMAEALDEALRNLPSDVASLRVPAGAAAAPLPAADRTDVPPADSGTVLAPPPADPRPPLAEERAAGAPRPVVSSRRHQQPPKGGGGRIALGLALAAALGAGAYVAVQQLGDGGSRPDHLADLPDSAVVGEPARGDTVDAGSPDAIKRAGLEAIRAGNWRLAEERLQLAVMLLPNDVIVRDAYAFALLKQGRAAEAERVLIEAQRIDPGFDLIYSHLADALLAQGDTARGRTALERFIGLTLDAAAREEAVRRLEGLRAAPEPEPPPAPTPQPTAPVDTLRMPPPAPRDTLRMGEPPGER